MSSPRKISPLISKVAYNRYLEYRFEWGMPSAGELRPIPKDVGYYYPVFRYNLADLEEELGSRRVAKINSIVMTEHVCATHLITQFPLIADKIYARALRVEHYSKVIIGFLKRFVSCYRRTHYQREQIIARYKGQSDVVCDIVFKKTDPYFVAAFSGTMLGDIEDGKFVIRCLKAGTTQEAVRLSCLMKTSPIEGASQIRRLLNESCTTVETIRSTMNAFGVLAGQWVFEQLSDLLTSFVSEYVNQTLHKMDKTNSFQRLELFVTKNPVLAQYIWETNFSTEEERRVLGVALNISQKNLRGFVASASMDNLKSFLSRKVDSRKTALDRLPPQIWAEIERCQQDLKRSKEGTPVGLRGRYISSDEIAAADTRLKEAWKRADKWLAANPIPHSGA